MDVFDCTFEKYNVFSRGCTEFEYSRLFTIFIFCTPPPDFIGVFEGQIVLQFWGLKRADFIGGIELDILRVDVQKALSFAYHSHDVSIRDWRQYVKRKLNISKYWNSDWKIGNVDNYLKCKCFIRKFNVDKFVDKKIRGGVMVFFYLFLVIKVAW